MVAQFRRAAIQQFRQDTADLSGSLRRIPLHKVAAIRGKNVGDSWCGLIGGGWNDSGRLVLCQSNDLVVGGRGWTERSEGSPGVSGCRPPTPATRRQRTAEAPGGRFKKLSRSPQFGVGGLGGVGGCIQPGSCRIGSQSMGLGADPRCKAEFLVFGFQFSDETQRTT
jgi:hypothetical protein